MMNRTGNVFTGAGSNADAEIVDVLATFPGARVERIVSTGQCSPDGFWYDQDEHEWVVVLSGEGKLQMEDREDTLHMRTGDFVYIRPHQRHRVESTSETEPTIWLAIFVSP